MYPCICMGLQASVYNIYIQDVKDSIPPSHCNYQKNFVRILLSIKCKLSIFFKKIIVRHFFFIIYLF